jgi:molecular chaperone GrpE
MGENRNEPARLAGSEGEEIEVEFIDEGSDAAAPGGRSEPAAANEEAVDLGPSVEIELERLERELDELRDIHLRKLAEFDNFRKRTERERVEIKRLANEELMRDLLPVLDNFERALHHGPEADADAFHEGVEMIARQLWDVLQRQGVDVIDPVGERFSPEVHEAVHQVEDSDLEPGTVATVLTKGYLYNGRLIRPAMVGVVANRPSSKPHVQTPEPERDGDADE